MQKALSHRHSFPLLSCRFSSQQGSLITLPPSPVFDGDNNAANMTDGMFSVINTPTVAAAATPGVDPGTTSTTPSSRFSEIEQISPSDPRLVSAIISPPPSTSPADQPQHSQHSQQYQQYQQYYQQQHIEPFISPLTEANLKFHTNSYPNTREARNIYIDSYVETQANVIQLETKLQRRRRAEIRSLVPLDTLSLSDEVIIQQPVIQTTTENLTIPLAENTTNNNNDDDNNNSNAHSDNSKKKRRRWFPRWLAPVRFKRKQEKGEEQQEERWKKDLGQQNHMSLGIAAMRKEGRAAGEGGTPINNDITDRQSFQQQRYSSPSPIGTSTVTPTTTNPPVSLPSHLHRNSWGAPETNYQQYQNEKLELLQEGLCGLNNINILRALGEHNRAVTGGSGRAGATTSMIILSSQPQQQRQLRQQEIKRDSGVSFITQQQQSNNNNNNNNSNNKTRRRFSARLRSVREQDEQEQQQQQQQQQHDQISNTSTLIGFRYPRMIHRQTLRDAAVHVLSSELSLYENEDSSNDNGYVDERNGGYYQDMDINRRHQQQEHIQGIGRMVTFGNQNYNSVRQRQQYQPRNKRFSDPGLMLYSR